MAYTLDENTKTYTTSTGRIAVEVGDSKEASLFLPRVKLCAWDNECNVSFGLAADSKATATVSEKDGKIVWAQGKTEAHFYELADGFEFLVILNEKPAANKVPISLNVPKELRFHYQPDLTGVKSPFGERHQPENVIDSWAVYHASKSGNKYEAGKAFHIYRLWATDANGKTDWCSLSLDVDKDGNLLSQDAAIILPEDFHAEAVAPIKIDPTFGFTSAGGSSIDGINNGIVKGGLDFTGAAGTATSMSMYGYLYGGGSCSFQCGIYNGNNKVGATGSGTVNSATPGWWTANFASGLSISAVSYSLCHNCNNSYMSIYYDTVAGASYYYLEDFGTWPSSVTWEAFENHKFSIYCTYTASGQEESGTTSLSGGGSVAASGTKGGTGTTSVSGGGSVASSGAKGGTGTTSISGGGTVAASGTKAASAGATLSGSGTLAASGEKAASGTSSLSGGGTLSATGSIPPPPDLELTGTFDDSVSLDGTFDDAAALTASFDASETLTGTFDSAETLTGTFDESVTLTGSF
jgi:hypothetical protein